MKNVKLFFVLVFCLLIKSVYSQVESCRLTEPQASKAIFNSKTILRSGGTVCVNVQFHIVRETNSTGGFSVSNLPGIINELNNWYNGFGVFFKQIGYDEISNSNYYRGLVSGRLDCAAKQ
ncbi:hypothetical protein M0G43_00830 [Subsaxibacter sp. CAU 1640]|uniref:hypothetical protein n=1 Tax=Subsaxibacter sp. CAU 1640 TaxID=2933271 RepID=UPI002003F772|nr:hypothetical protein [Subsaxibacter sp. CAU 1640]MCK7589108.1 hypothetical protein [Subsaxibacter sp. CAU 1640]